MAPSHSHSRKPRSAILRGFIFVLWFGAVSIPLVILSAGHMVPLPSDSPLVQTEGSLGSAGDSNWQVIHILAAGCPCSQRSADYLLQRTASGDPLVEEVAWIVGGEAGYESDMKVRGFDVQHLEGQKLVDEHGIHGGPWLLILNPAGEPVYSGGYAKRKPIFPHQFQDTLILAQSRLGNPPEAFPAFGCATSAWLQETMDPAGIKY